ncbi:MFS general substrate transporter [Meredithblackwellia eburnea MCA 4105]
MLSLAFSLFLSFFDSTSVATAFPQMAEELKAGETISWVGTSYLTSSQLIVGRLSDIFGRKNCLLACLAIFAAGDLLCGFAKTPIQLYVFRSFSGIGAGGINNMAMVVMSDVTSLRERNKWQGYITSSIAAGSAAGPFVGAALVTKLSWRYLFWLIVPFVAPCMFITWRFIPLKKVEGSVKEKLRKVDYLGSFFSLAANICLLTGISSGGSLYPWKSSVVIGLIVAGVALWAVFIVIQWKVAALPVLPLRLFTYRSPSIVICTFFLIGFAYYINLFYLPRYFQTLLGLSPTMSATLLLALLLVQTFSGFINGQITRFSGQVKYQINIGFILFMIGVGLETTFGLKTSKAQIAGFLVIQGIGTGGVIGSSLVAAQAGAPPADRAVVTGARNFTRSFGGAFGIAIANAVLQNSLARNLPKSLPAAVKESIVHGSSLSIPDSVDAATKQACYDAYAKGLRYIWIMLCPAIAICLVSSFFIQRDELYDAAKVKPVEAKSEESSKASEDLEKGKLDDDSQTAVAEVSSGRSSVVDGSGPKIAADVENEEQKEAERTINEIAGSAEVKVAQRELDK